MRSHEMITVLQGVRQSNEVISTTVIDPFLNFLAFICYCLICCLVLCGRLNSVLALFKLNFFKHHIILIHICWHIDLYLDLSSTGYNWKYEHFVLQISSVLFESFIWIMGQHWQNRVSGLLAVVLLASVLNVQSKDDDDKARKESVGTVIGIDLGTTYSWSVLITEKLILFINLLCENIFTLYFIYIYTLV